MVHNSVSKMIDLRPVTIEIWTQKVGFVPMWGKYYMGVYHIKIVDGLAPENLGIVQRDRF